VPSRRARAVRLLVVAAAAVLPYLNALGAGWAFDDAGLVVGNPMATPGMSALAWFGRPSATGSLYRPLTMVTYALVDAAGGGARAQHALNVVLHAATSVAVLLLGDVVLRSPRAAVGAALVFALHPVHTEAVANVAGRAELLAALGVVVALVAFARGARGPALAAFAAGVLAKESAFTGLVLAALVARWTARRGRSAALAALGPWVVVAGAALALRATVVGALGLAEPPPFVDNPLAWVSPPARLATALVVLVQYLGTLAVPIRLSADESFDQVPVVHAATDPRLLLATGVLAALALGVVAARRRAPVLAFAAAFFVAALAVTANVVVPIGTIKAERLLYLPSVGWCLACGWAGRWLVVRHQAPGAAVVAALLVSFAARTWVRNADWHDEYALFTATVAASPMSARAHANAAAVHANAGELASAFAHYKAALRILPTYAPAALGLGQIAEARGQWARAVAWYARALVLDPTLARAAARRAALLARVRGG